MSSPVGQPAKGISIADLLATAALKEMRAYPHSCHADKLVINMIISIEIQILNYLALISKNQIFYLGFKLYHLSYGNYITLLCSGN